MLEACGDQHRPVLWAHVMSESAEHNAGYRAHRCWALLRLRVLHLCPPRGSEVGILVVRRVIERELPDSATPERQKAVITGREVVVGVALLRRDGLWLLRAPPAVAVGNKRAIPASEKVSHVAALLVDSLQIDAVAGQSQTSPSPTSTAAGQPISRISSVATSLIQSIYKPQSVLSVRSIWSMSMVRAGPLLPEAMESLRDAAEAASSLP